MAANGDLALVLHAHLPFIRHPEHRYHLEENWLYEACAATYLPLLDVFRGLARDGVPFRMTMSLSPPLCAMLSDDLLKTRTAAYLERLVRLGDRELERTATDPTFHGIARFYADRFGRIKALYDELRGDLVGAFRALQDDGLLEIITVGATHGYMPVIREPSARRAQIQVAAESYQRSFGRWPRGIWLPECGYTEGLDGVLAEVGLRYFFVDAHGIVNAKPQPPLGIHAPVFCKSGVAAFGRDLESSKQVWSAKEGYPGDGVYRDFYRDIGFDLPADYIGPFIHPDGIRVHTGYKYFRVTGPDVDLAHKQPYDPHLARERAAQHAGNFMFNREKQIEHLATRMDRRPLVVSPYDAELYGHWWFEGPWFLDFLARKMAYDQTTVRLATCADYLEDNTVNAIAEPLGVDPSRGQLAVEAAEARQVRFYAIAGVLHRRAGLHDEGPVARLRQEELARALVERAPRDVVGAVLPATGELVHARLGAVHVAVDPVVGSVDPHARVAAVAPRRR